MYVDPAVLNATAGSKEEAEEDEEDEGSEESEKEESDNEVRESRQLHCASMVQLRAPVGGMDQRRSNCRWRRWG